MTRTRRIGVGASDNGWGRRLLDALAIEVEKHCELEVVLIEIDGDAWIDAVEACDIFLWKPRNMGIEAASYLKEKIYFIEYFLKKIVIPNFSTVWHFESKVAQTYLFRKFGVRTPKTVVSFSKRDALKCLAQFRPPFVFKKGRELVRLTLDS